jgi:hypothetical protein
MKPNAKTDYPKRSIVYDISNIAFEVAVTHLTHDKSLEKDPQMLGGISMHTLLLRIHKYFRMLNPDQVVFAFEGGNNWRKAWTKSDKSVSGKVYKSNRVSEPTMLFYYNMLQAFIEVCTQHTSVICLNVPTMEADDCIAAYCQQNASPEHEVIVISGDKDFVQLLRNPHVKLLNQREAKYRNQPGDKFYYDDLEYFIFEKCVRGDKGDWVFPAYPRVRETKIRKAYEDAYARVNFMNETWEEKLADGTKKVHRVGDLFEENKILVDLLCQPDDLKKILHDGVAEQAKNHGKYSDFHFLKFLGQYKLKKISEEVHKFQDVFVRNSQHANGQIAYKTSNTKDQVENVEEERGKTKTLAELQQKSKSGLFQF